MSINSAEAREYSPEAQELASHAIPENTPNPSTNIDGLSEDVKAILRQYDCFTDETETALRYNVLEANDCVFLVDPLKPELQDGEQAVYPHHDEAADLRNLAMSLGEHFNTVIDAFRGGGHAIIPILKDGTAEKGKSIDNNPRSIPLEAANAEINGVADRIETTIGDTATELPEKEGKTLFVANPPFALAVKGVQLDTMRDGGANGLTLTNAYLHKAISNAESGDVIIGVAYSRIREDGTIEVEESIKYALGEHGTYEIDIVAGRTLWRGPNGKKEQPNPMPLSEMHTKALSENEEAVTAYNQASEFHQKEGWTHLGYYQYVIRI